MDPLLISDIARFAHIFAVTIGLGGAFLADYHVLSRLKQPITKGLIDVLEQYHKHVSIAILAMWVTGLIMIYIRTGFVLENFSPKLISKLGVVAVLTLNAVFIGKIAMPILAANLGARPIDLPLRQKIGTALMSGVSTISWLLALGMGVSKVLAASAWATFLIVVPLSYSAAVFGAIATILLMDGVRLAQQQIKTRSRTGHRACTCPACQKQSDVLEQLVALRHDIMALRSNRAGASHPIAMRTAAE